jgi:hypothetical protein
MMEEIMSRSWQLSLVLFCIANVASTPHGTASDVGLAPEENRIDISIRNSSFVFDRPVASQPGMPTVIVLRNEDIVRHGFTSSILRGVMVRAEGEGISAYGRSLEGFYVGPGKTLVLRLTIDEPGKHSFQCDLHPGMKGEVLVLDMSTA